MSKFFSPDGKEEMGKEDFIKFYNQVYYYLNRDICFEDSIDALLDKNTLTRKDIVNILGWKIGATTYDYESEVVKNRNGSINVGELINRLGCDPLKKEFKKEELWKKDAKETLDILTKQKGMGPVYAITMLYFLSSGKSLKERIPIYDRFAKMALLAIRGDKKPGEAVEYKELPGKDSRTKFSEIMSKNMPEYIAQIEDVFGLKEYWETRDIDRALWAYGHLFNNKKK